MTILRILHLSDTHLMGDGTLHEGTVDTVAAYQFTLDSFANAGPLDLVVVSGDVSDDGSPDSYRRVRSMTQNFAQRHGAVAVYAMGNHDQRAGFREVLGNGHGAYHPENGAATDPAAPIVGVSHVAGYRIITLDSSVPGRTHGHVDTAQLAWLRAELSARYVHGTVVVIHHPPVEPETALHQGIELLNPADLAGALADTDAVAILSGHYHHHLTDVLVTGSAMIPVVVTSGIVNTNDVLAPAGHERAVAGSGGTLVTVRAVPIPSAHRQFSQPRLRTLPQRFALPADVSPDVVFDLDEPVVVDIAHKISATPAERLTASQPTAARPSSSSLPPSISRPLQERPAHD